MTDASLPGAIENLSIHDKPVLKLKVIQKSGSDYASNRQSYITNCGMNGTLLSVFFLPQVIKNAISVELDDGDMQQKQNT